MARNQTSAIKYPKFLLLILTYVIAFFIVSWGHFSGWESFLSQLGYAGAFIGGFFYTYGFTSGPATAFLVLLGQSNHLLLTALIAGVGSVLGDLVIFRFIRSSLSDEINLLSQERFFRWLKRKLPAKIRNVLALILGFIAISSPLPDEVGVFIISAGSKIRSGYFIPLSYVLNTTGIYIILLLAK